MTPRSVLILGRTREDAYNEAQQIIPPAAVLRRYPYAWVIGRNPEHHIYLETLGNLRTLRGLRYDYLRLTAGADAAITAEQLELALVGRRPR